MRTATIGVELVKNVFPVCEVDAVGHVLTHRHPGHEAFVLWRRFRPTRLIGILDAPRCFD